MEGAWSCVFCGSSDPIVFRVRLCGFRSVFSDLQLSSLAIVDVVLRWSFGVLAR
jgi:hypothetical protein